jgi:hypothetical protein
VKLDLLAFKAYIETQELISTGEFIMQSEIPLNEIIEDLQGIEPKILEYEKKYRLLSPYFHKLYKAGKLEEHWDFQNWAGLYEIKLDRIAEYKQRLAEVLSALPLVDTVEEDFLVHV